MKSGKQASQEKKPIFKKWWFWVIVVIVIGGVFGSLGGKSSDNNNDNDNVKNTTVSTPEAIITPEVQTPQPEQTDNSENSEKERLQKELGVAIGDTAILYTDWVRNDVTGRWRLARIASSQSIVDHAAEYYHAYFESDDEVHVVVNFTLNTTTVITKLDSTTLDATVHEYVDKEEHDANILAGGTVLGQYFVNIETGEVTELTDEE